MNLPQRFPLPRAISEEFDDCILVASREIPSNEDWDDLLWRMQEMVHRVGRLRVLVWAQSGVSPLQRAKLLPILKGVDFRIAVLTRSRLARGTITAFRWMGADSMQAFDPSASEEALDYLGIVGSHRARLQRRLLELTRQIGAS